MTPVPLDTRRIAAAVEAVLAEFRGLGVLTLDQVRRMAAAAEAEAVALGLPVVFAAVDDHGGLMLVHRMDGALPASLDIAIDKAFTAAMFRMPTHELGALAQPGQPLYGVQHSQQGRVMLLGGGYPCRHGDAVVGAIGVSGGTVEQDLRIVARALSIFLDETGQGLGGGKSYE